MLKIYAKVALSFLIISKSLAQPLPTTGEKVMESYRLKKKLSEMSMLNDYPARAIGPVVQGGRVVDIVVNESNAKEFYVAYASGGVFKTDNNGITFEPIFDEQGAITIGDLALASSNKDILYVGTGEKNSSRSSYAGSGVYKTLDGGKSWEHLGLEATQHTSRIIIHPTNPDIVWVASIGALYTHNADRGVYKSSNGGKTWKKTLFINDSTGIIDLVSNPGNPNQLWAASWERTRKSWNFKGNGPGSAIYRSDDGGETWKKLSKGFTQGTQTGRIGLSISRSKPNVLYALVDNQKETKAKKKGVKDGKLRFEDFAKMNNADFLALDDEKLNVFLKENGFPKKYNADVVKRAVKSGKYAPKALAAYFGDANRALFTTKITGAELFRSDNFGDTWEKVNSYQLDGVYYTYGYYFGEVRVDPNDESTVYIFGVPLLKSSDGGKTFNRIDTVGNVHVDHQTLWIDPKDSEHLLLGNDGGLYQSYDQGGNWGHINNVSVGQFYTVGIDMETPYNVYGGLQDNGIYVGSSNSVPNKTKKWEKILSGDGMFVAPDPRKSDIVYVGYQFGHYFRKNLTTLEQEKVTPKHDIGEDRLRFNWRTPFIISPHNADIVYTGAQKLFRSVNQGRAWEVVSPDLTKNHPQGNVPYSTISCIAESSMKFSLLYVGTDDGNIQVSKDGGGSWNLVTGGLPENLWVSSVHPSAHQLGRVYASLNGYRDDHFNTYVYVSEDYGKNWRPLKNNLPEVVVNIIYEDPVNANLLYLGTDHGTYISMNRGEEWHLLNSIPNVAAYDMKVHSRENELVIATHGRSMYVVDAKPLQSLMDTDVSIKAFQPTDVKYSSKWGPHDYPYERDRNPKVNLPYYIGKVNGTMKVEIFNEANQLIVKKEIKPKKGFNQYTWDLKVNNTNAKKQKAAGKSKYIGKGKYRIKFTNGDKTDETILEVK